MVDQENTVVVNEVGLRDGLQAVERTMSTIGKRKWIDAAYAAGVRHMEVASFVSPRLLPQMADAAEVIAHARSLPGLLITALVPNLRGAESAVSAGAHRIVAPISVSTEHSLANVRKTPRQMIDEFRGIRELLDCDPRGATTTLIAGLSTAFGCTRQGHVPSADVCEIARLAVAAGCDLLSLGDTTGYATPGQVGRLIDAVRAAVRDMPMALHFHDTRGMGLANTIVALQHGIREFDASLAGLGGCPAAPGASGNVTTEDMVFMLESMGYSTGIDIMRLVASRALLEEYLPGEPLHGYIARSGLPKNFTGVLHEGAASESAPKPAPDAATARARLPLEGIRVVEMSHMVMGPTCGMILGDLGAEVIKVEPPRGDGTRRLLGAGAGFFRTFNRNKKSVSLDVDQPAAREALQRLAATADVFIENFKPGRMAELGLDYATLREKNPRLIHVSHKGFLSGPYEDRLALDEVVQMMAGLAYMTGPVGRPLRAGSSVNDIMGGMFGAIGALAALFEREHSGVGKEVQSALFENCVLLCAQHMQQFAVTGRPAAPMPERINAWAVYDVFQLAGGEQMFLAATGDGQWKSLCNLLGLEALLADEALATNNQRVLARERILPILAGALVETDSATLVPRLEAAEIPFASIRRPEELFDDPHLLASGGLADLKLDDGSSTQMPLLPFSLDGIRLLPRRPIPTIGENTGEVLLGLGYSDAQLGELAASGAAKLCEASACIADPD
jgi:crotonobetainyl-CoA:carnitine CoA-transferase CaiB-like acyl-CoA transferase/isopropylmalate/homocitrate/citramalate synthase